ncbi:hypothetical protein D7I39_10925 [Allopusillimonas ginsengisoli]|nr:hypothetical protein D7I39_10925 [Allopusillimonas ginsengisoli]
MLKLVPPREPTPSEKLLERVKKRARPDGMLQCNRCGGRTLMTLTHGVIVKNGRKQRGTIIEKDVCYDCHKRGIFSPMIIKLKAVK